VLFNRIITKCGNAVNHRRMTTPPARTRECRAKWGFERSGVEAAENAVRAGPLPARTARTAGHHRAAARAGKDAHQGLDQSWIWPSLRLRVMAASSTSWRNDAFNLEEGI